MDKLLLNSILVATIAIPLYAARAKRFGSGFRMTVVGTVAASLIYALVMLYGYEAPPPWVPPDTP